MFYFSFDKHINGFTQFNSLITVIGAPLIIKQLSYLKMFWRTSPKPIIDPFYEYYQQNKSKFSASFDKNINYNQNIDSVFYIKSEFRELIMVEGNNLEKEWRTRILFETTPRGNIIMFYDPYKQGFSYYSDSTGIPYNILNAVAMKYVLMFRCRDFFVDNNVIHYFNESSSDALENLNKYESPLIPLYYTEKTSKKSNLHNKTGSQFNKIKSYGPFDNKNILPFNTLVGIKQRIPLYHKILNLVINIKRMITKSIISTFKQIQDIFIKKENLKKIESKKEEPEKEYNYNRFIQMGKISNFRIIQFPQHINLLNGFKTNLLDGISSETRLQKQVMSYKDYKLAVDALLTT